MAGFWPLYSNFVNKAEVTLALPGIPSNIAKMIGKQSDALLLVPNIDFIIAFMNGDLGIADSIAKKSMEKMLNSPIASSDEMVARHFSKANGLGLEDKLSNFKKDGKLKIPGNEITLPQDSSELGLKAMEKAILQSIFETQKPYMEIAKIIIDSIIDVEDIIARVMPLLSLSPLTAKSAKPIGNAGGGRLRPKAIGYGGGKDIKQALAKLNKVSKVGGKLKLDKDGNPSREKDESGTNLVEGPTDPSLLQNEKLKEMGKSWKIVDVIYSTGMYDPKIEYIYTYVDLPADDNIKGKKADEEPDDEDPYDKYKPDRIIFGIFDSSGAPLDPMSGLYTITDKFDPNNPQSEFGKMKTPFPKADWVTKSPKWVFPKSDTPNINVWPTFGAPIFRWKGTLANIGQKRDAKEKPSDSKLGDVVVGSWELLKYEKDQKNVNSGMDAEEGKPVIAEFETSDVTVYTKYFTEYTKTNIELSQDLDGKEKADGIKTIMEQLNVKSHLENVGEYAQNKISYYKDFSIPKGMGLAFKPMQITVDAAKTDPKLVGLNGRIWIDPEADYEMKIIQVKPVSKIQYSGAKGEPQVEAKIQSFVKNKAIFKFSKNEKFNIDIRKNNSNFDSVKGVESYVLDNWNFDPTTKRVSSTNDYEIDIWHSEPQGILGKEIKAANIIKMGLGTKYQEHGDWSITIELKNGKYTYKEGIRTGTAALQSSSGDGIKKIGDGTLVLVKAGVIEKWFRVYSKKMNQSILPAFGYEKTFNYSMDDIRTVTSLGLIPTRKESWATENLIKTPIYQMKVSNKDSNNLILDPSKITNEHLQKDELYSTGKYGVGSQEDPQELGTIYRYAKTDLDTETYYIIEGVRPEKNDSGGEGGGGGAAASGSGGGWYRLPHAIGAIPKFIKLLIKIVVKLFPAINKLLKLLKNPMSFVVDIITEKLGTSFSIFSKDALKKFEGAADLAKKKSTYMKAPPAPKPGQPAPMVPKMSDYVRLMKAHFANSKLKNHVAVDSLGNFKDASGKVPKTPPIQSIGNFKFIADGIGFIPFSMFGKDLSFGIELKMGNVITKEWGNPSPMRLIFKKDKNGKNDGSDATKSKGVDSDSNKSLEDAKAAAQTKADTNQLSNAKRAAAAKRVGGEGEYAIVSTWYSTGEFIKGVNYKYIYIDQSDEQLMAEADKLADSIDPKDLQDAKRMLEDELAKNPNKEALQNKLDEINKKIGDLSSNTQPLLKLILGLVTLPLKIIAGIIQWLLDFFKSLTNPMMLPAKMIEFLSFKWILDFFTPKGIMKLAGIEFDPAKPAEFMAKATMPNPLKSMSPDKIAEMAKKNGTDPTKVKAGVDGKTGKVGETSSKISDTKKPDMSAAQAKAAEAEKAAELPKNVPPHKGAYALPDDFAMADLKQFLSVGFLAQLPTYTTSQMRLQGKNITKRVFSPIICFIEKLINGFIDFIWSILGIEVIIPPPHIKLCDEDEQEAKDKIANGESPGGGATTSSSGTSGASPNANTTQIMGTNPFISQTPPLEKFVYEVKMQNGEIKRFLDKESLDEFMKQNSNIGFDIQF